MRVSFLRMVQALNLNILCAELSLSSALFVFLYRGGACGLEKELPKTSNFSFLITGFQGVRPIQENFFIGLTQIGGELLFRKAIRVVLNWLAVRGEASGPLLCPVNKGKRVTLRRLTSQAVLFILQKRGEEAGVASFSTHDFRRTFISDLLDAGVDLVTVQRLAGHSDPSRRAIFFGGDSLLVETLPRKTLFGKLSSA